MVFLVISIVSLFEVDNDTDDLVSVGRQKNDSMLCCAIVDAHCIMNNANSNYGDSNIKKLLHSYSI